VGVQRRVSRSDSLLEAPEGKKTAGRSGVLGEEPQEGEPQ